MNAVPKLPKLILISPWFLLVFLVVPCAVVLNLTLHLGLVLFGPRVLLINNICFAFLAACRFVWYLSRLNKNIRYGAGSLPSRSGFEVSLAPSQARGILSGAGFTFPADGSYGEKRDLGYLGTAILYGGLLLLLAAGSWDNLRQFSGMVLDGVGPATKLSQAESYGELTMGPFAANLKSLPQLRILSQILPDSTYPKGATEIALIPEHGTTVTTVLIPTVPFHYGAFDVYMTKLVFQPELVIKSKDSRVIFDNLVQLDPLVQKRGAFGFYGLFVGADIIGGAYYHPEKSQLMVVITRNGKRVVTDMTFQVDQQVVAGDYLLSCAKMGQWSEIHVVHRRHKGLLILGGIIVILGLVLRLVFRPQRVWLEEMAGACRVMAVGKEAEQLLKR